MATKTSALTVRKNLGRLLEEAFYKGDEFIIERAGRPMAALIPIQEFEKLQKQRKKDLSIFDKARTKADGPATKEVEKEVAQAIRKVRKNAKGRP